jgi:tRNA(fMet)-specific endonuclease VapC
VRDFLLDTQTILYWHDPKRAQHAAVVENVARLRQAVENLEIQPKLLISVISLGEIEYGHRAALAPDHTAQAAYVAFVSQELPEALDLSRDATEVYGELRARLFNKFAPGDKRKPKMVPEQLVDPATAKELGVQENDLWLCAQAIAHQMVLITNDRMTRIREVSSDMSAPLLTQNWTQADTAHMPN